MLEKLKSPSRLVAGALIGLAFGLANPGMTVMAQSYPDHPVRMLLPFPAGGSTDATARMYTEELSAALGQQVVLENQGGGGGIIAVDAVAKAAPDGYTIMHAAGQNVAASAALNASLPFDVRTDLQAITLVGSQSPVLFTRSDAPYSTVEELIEAIKAAGSMTYASTGNGGVPHLSGLLFGRAIGLDVRHIPYTGGSQAITDVISGQVDYMFFPYSSIAGQVLEGRIKLLAVAGPERLSFLPDLPTMAELGFPDVALESWQAVYVPAGTPADIVTRLHDAVVTALTTQAVAERAATNGFTIRTTTPEEAQAFTASEVDRYKELIALAGIQPQ